MPGQPSPAKASHSALAKCQLAIWAGCTLLGSAAVDAQSPAYIPAEPTTRLLRVDPRDEPLFAVQKPQVRKTPGGADSAMEYALAFANRQLDLGGEKGEARYLGFARAALRPWWGWSDDETPLQLKMARARIHARAHAFADAASEYESVLARWPGHAAASLGLAFVRLAEGQTRAARVHCESAHRTQPSIASAVCIGLLDGMQGHSVAALHRIDAALGGWQSARGRRPGRRVDLQTHAWALGAMAEIASRAGDEWAAVRYLERANSLRPNDVSITAALADSLLQVGRPSQVVALIPDATTNDELLLQRIRALRELGGPNDEELDRATSRLLARFEAAAKRGESSSALEAEYWLSIRDAPRRALPLALNAWNIERTRTNTLLIARAAHRLGRPLPPNVRAWLDSAQVQDAGLAMPGAKRGASDDT